MLMNFHYVVPTSIPSNLVENGPVVSEKRKFNFNVNDLGPRSRN